MAISNQVPTVIFNALVSRAGMDLNNQELTELKQAYDVFQAHVDTLHSAQLDAEDLAVSFDPVWDPKS